MGIDNCTLNLGQLHIILYFHMIQTYENQMVCASTHGEQLSVENSTSGVFFRHQESNGTEPNAGDAL